MKTCALNLGKDQTKSGNRTRNRGETRLKPKRWGELRRIVVKMPKAGELIKRRRDVGTEEVKGAQKVPKMGKKREWNA